MADQQISVLPAANTALPTDIVPVVTAGQTSKITLQALVASSAQLAGTSARVAGATGNGSTNDGPAFVTAQSAATSAGGAIYVPPGSYVFTAAMTFTVPVYFAPGAVLLPATGIVLTFSRPIIAGLVQIFGGAGTISFTYGTTVYPEWWGAIPSVTTDDAPFIQAALNSLPVNFAAAGVVELQATLYAIHSTIRHTKAGVALRGQGRNATVLYCTATGMDAIYVTAPGTNVPQAGSAGTNPPPGGGTATLLQWPRVEKLSILQPSPNATGYGITLCYTAEALVEDILITGFLVGVSLQRASNTQLNRIDVSNTSPGATSCIGFYIDGSPQAGDNNPTGGNASTRFHYCTAASAPTTTGAYGFYVFCSNSTLKGTIGDLHFFNCETNFCTTGFWIDARQVLTTVDGAANIILMNPTVDSALTYGIYIIADPITNKYMNVQIIGGLLNTYGTNGSLVEVALTNCRGVSLTNVLFFQPATATSGIVYGLLMQDCVGILVNGCTFKSLDHWLTMITSSYTMARCSIHGCSFFGSADGSGPEGGHTPNPGMQVTGNGHSILGNTFDGVYGGGVPSAIVLDSTTTYCLVGFNTFNKGTAAPLAGGTATAIITNTIINSGTSNTVVNNNS